MSQLRQCIVFIFVLLTISTLVSPMISSIPTSTPPMPSKDGLRRFLESQYVPEAGLLRAAVYAEGENTTIYVASDNLLAFRALRVLDSPLADIVKKNLMNYPNHGHSFLHEVLLGINIPDEIRTPKVYVLDRVYSQKFNTDFVIKYEVRNGTLVFFNWYNFADLIVYKALDKMLEGNISFAEECFRRLMSKWDGHGFADISSDTYETYKLALAVFLYRALKTAGSTIVDEYTDTVNKIYEILAQLQREDGGMVTHYRIEGDRIVYAGDANTETTSIVVLALYSRYPDIIGSIAKLANSKVVGVYYYVWYGDGGYGKGRHWNNTAYGLVLEGDKPAIGYYSSLNKNAVDWQLSLMKKAGIDVVFLSWWGPQSYEDWAARIVFEKLREYGLKAAILVEPFLGGDPNLYDEEFWNTVFDYIYREYLTEYTDVFFYLNGKPLILAYNPIGMTYRPSSDLFEVRIIGNDIDNAGYQDWDPWPDYLAPWTKPKDVELRIRRDGYVAIAPRFDDMHFCKHGIRVGCAYRLLDPDYSLNAYLEQWRWIVEHRDKIRIVAIYSWNEYHERSMIEPHYDATAKNNYDPYKLYNDTIKYIKSYKEGLPIEVEETTLTQTTTKEQASEKEVTETTTQTPMPPTLTTATANQQLTTTTTQDIMPPETRRKDSWNIIALTILIAILIITILLLIILKMK